MTRTRAMFYNALAVLSTGLGLVNSLLAWRLFGVGSDADAWLLSLTVISTLNMIALLGVEQFLYCYADKQAHAPAEAEDFAKTALLWSLLCGGAFAAISALAAPYLVRIFAGGFTDSAQHGVTILLVAMLPQTAAMPLLHVTRQLHNAHERYTSAYLFALWTPSVLLIAQLMGLLSGISIGRLAWIVGAGGVGQVALCLYAVRSWLRAGHLLTEPVQALRDLIWKSMWMRGGHALHNFLSAVIINGALSTLPTGNIALFQYAKRFADGISSVAVGPHGNIYHARLAKAWSERNQRSVREAARAYLTHVMPLFMAGVVLVWLALPYLLTWSASQAQVPVDDLASVFLVASVWSGLIAFESVFVGMLTTAHRAGVFILVNGLFIAVFFWLTRLDLGLATIFKLPAAASLAQVVSLVLFMGFSLNLFRRHFSRTGAPPCA